MDEPHNAALIQIDPRSHLEVADRAHRYAKNLRLYYKEYSRLLTAGVIIEPSNDNTATGTVRDRFEPFFRWLDESTKKPEVCPYSHACTPPR